MRQNLKWVLKNGQNFERQDAEKKVLSSEDNEQISLAWAKDMYLYYVLTLKEKEHFEKVVGASHILSVLNIRENIIHVITGGPKGQA